MVAEKIIQIGGYNIFDNVGFPKETRQNLPFIEKYATTSKFSYI